MITMRSSALGAIRGLFRDKLVEDHRAPIAVFQLTGGGGRYAIFAPCQEFWLQLLFVLLLQIALQCAFAAIIYTQIVKKRLTTATTYSYLVGFGIVIPIALYLPYVTLEGLGIENKAIRLGLSTFPTIVVFRCVEAMYGTSPDVVETTLGTYVAYYTSLMHFEWDPKTMRRRRITASEFWETIRRTFLHFHLVSLLLSFEMQHDYVPFRSSPVALDSFYLGWDLFSPSHLLNSYLLVLLTFYMLSTSFEVAAFAENAKGLYTKPIFHNPLFTSRTPTEFWGAKWNMMIHRILKHGVYLPARKFLSSRGAVAATFVGSGLLHDYCWSLIFYHPIHRRNDIGVCAECFTPIPLKLTAFFMWCGVVMLLERPVLPYCSGLAKNLPTPVVATLLLAVLALPVAHWYTGDWAVGGMYSDYALALWHIKKIS